MSAIDDSLVREKCFDINLEYLRYFKPWDTWDILNLEILEIF